MKKYYPSLNLIKFVCAIGIVWVHQSGITGNVADFPFASNGILVEFFYAITGLLTYKHFYYQDKNNSEDIMLYCAKKYVRLFPYILISVMGCFLVTNFGLLLSGNIHGIIYEARDLPIELLMLRSATTEATRFKTYNGILWFLSAMFIVLPFFCFICTALKRYALIISVLFCELWYVGTNVKHSSYDWESLCRALAGLMLGIIIFHFGTYIASRIGNTGGAYYSLIEVFIFLFILISLYKNYHIPKVQIVLYVVFMSIIYSQKAIQLKYNMSVVNFLGEFSMIMYFAHPIAQRIVTIYLKDFSSRIWIYLFISFMFSILIYGLERLVKKEDNFYTI